VQWETLPFWKACRLPSLHLVHTKGHSSSETEQWKCCQIWLHEEYREQRKATCVLEEMFEQVPVIVMSLTEIIVAEEIKLIFDKLYASRTASATILWGELCEWWFHSVSYIDFGKSSWVNKIRYHVFICVLIKLRTYLPNKFLGYIFNVSLFTIS